MLFKKSLWQGLTFVFAILLSVVITVAIVLEAFRSTVDQALDTRSSMTVSDGDGSDVYSLFTPPDELVNKDADGKIVSGNSNALIAKAISIGERLAAEGCVLLKNENEALPLTSGNKVTLLGVRSHKPILGASMGGSVSGGIISLETALGKGNSTEFRNPAYQVSGVGKPGRLDEFEVTTAGYEINPTMVAAYEGATVRMSFTAGNTGSECAVSDLESANPSFRSSFAQFNNAAIVVIGRGGSEGSDYSKTGLALSDNEKATLQLAKDGGFEKIIVLINTANPVEIEELKADSKIDAIMWIGLPGAYGTLGVADVLTGKVNPSGGLPDTFAVKETSAPASVNFGDYEYADANRITRTYRTTNPKYVVEAEGIYVGYRYYETRYYDGVLDRFNANSATGAVASTGNWKYSEEVSYSFGYGLSYTTFKKTITGQELRLGTNSAQLDLKVKVENLSEVAGKTSVQIYGQAPFAEGQAEKSAIQLLAFDKTDVIEGNGEVELTVTVDLQDIATYYSNYDNGDGTKGTYYLDDGEYYFAVGNGVHDALNNILAKQGKTPENTGNRMDAAGDADAAIMIDREEANIPADTFSVSKTGAKIQNQIPYADWNYYQSGKVTYLSRTDWSGTWPKEYTGMSIPDSMLTDLNGDYYTVKTGETSPVKWNDKGTDYRFYQMAGADYNDERWEDMLSQMSLEEAMYFAAFGGTVFPAVESVGLLETYLADNAGTGIAFTLANTKDASAPWAIESTDNNANWKGGVFPCSPLIAATFNHGIIEEEGEFIGIESLFVGISILWGPGLNTHRTAFCGRNNEYYSEDPVLSGHCAMSFSYGALKYGLIAAPKHFAFNDQETNRQGISPFMTEQRAREVELRAYQIAVESNMYDEYDDNGEKTKDAAMIGLMISFSKIGGVECTCSHGLLTDILRGEWGFHGYAVTDIYDDNDLFAAVLYAGSTGYDMRGLEGYGSTTIIGTSLGTQKDGSTITANSFAGDATLQQSLRTSNHDLLWALAQSNLTNRYSENTRSVWLMTWWRAVYISAIVVFSVAALSSAAMYTLSYIKGKKEEE